MLPLPQIHHLVHVLRQRAGQQILLFNEREGEWVAQLEEPTDAPSKKKGLNARVLSKNKSPLPLSPLVLFFPPLKPEALHFLIEKATELGVTELCPIQTARSLTGRFNSEKVQDYAQGASEQCERCDLPLLHPLRPLESVLSALSYPLFACLERNEKTIPIAQAFSSPNVSGKSGILIGPEGGFTEEEQQLLQCQPFVTGISLGPLILRSETAGLAALSIFQALKS